jgi:hypothetical protein
VVSSSAIATPSPISTGPTSLPPATPFVFPTLRPQEATVGDLLPSRLGGRTYAAMGMTVLVEQDIAGGSDMCIFWCAGELAAYAKQLGVSSGQITFVQSGPTVAAASPAVVFRAIRLPGAPEDKLIAAWAKHERQGLVDLRQISGKQAAFIWFDLRDDYRNVFAYAHGDVLFLINADIPKGMPQDIPTPAIVVEAVKALP